MLLLSISIPPICFVTLIGIKNVIIIIIIYRMTTWVYVTIKIIPTIIFNNFRDNIVVMVYSKFLYYHSFVITLFANHNAPFTKCIEIIFYINIVHRDYHFPKTIYKA